MKSGYSPPAIIVPIASSAVCPVSQVSFTLTPVFSSMIFWISLSSLISVPGTAKNASNSFALPVSVPPFLPLSLPHPANSVAAIVVTSSMLTIFFLLILYCPPF